MRAPIEFDGGATPGSVNLPILNNEERAKIGTTYKQLGQEAAIAQGYELVSGQNREDKIAAWKASISQNAGTTITCFRGGMRSRIAQQWLAESGVHVPRIEGGYKKIRQLFINTVEEFSKTRKLLVISGATGAGKTVLLRQMSEFRSILDLELAAHHRGSAFGGFGDGQPNQVNFENKVAVDVLRLPANQIELEILVEDESRLIGRCVQPESFFENLRSAAIVLVEETIESRVATTFDEYIINSDFTADDELKQKAIYDRYQKSLEKISKKLGGLKTSEIRKDLADARDESSAGRGFEAHKIWIQKLLLHYYDPLYFYSLERRSPKIRFRGDRQAVKQYLMANVDSK